MQTRPPTRSLFNRSITPLRTLAAFVTRSVTPTTGRATSSLRTGECYPHDNEADSATLHVPISKAPNPRPITRSSHSPRPPSVLATFRSRVLSNDRGVPAKSRAAEAIAHLNHQDAQTHYVFPPSPTMSPQTSDRSLTPSPSLCGFGQISYTPNRKDPLDVEVARVVNSIPHGFMIRRLDPKKNPSHRSATNEVCYEFARAGRRSDTKTCFLAADASPRGSSKSTRSKSVQCRIGAGGMWPLSRLWLDIN